MTLSDFIGGRNNNFNLIRFTAALAVLISHGVAITTGNPAMEPLRQQLNMTPGTMAVDIFFLTSGFLVSASLLTRKNTIEFICARALRIYPALWMMLVIVVFLLGASMTSLPLIDYLKSSGTWSYFVLGGTLLAGIGFELPQVFHVNPVGPAINGSLWTLPYEVGMYGILLAGWLVMRVFNRHRVQMLQALILMLASLAGLYILVGYFRHGVPAVFELHVNYALPSLIYMFFCGASIYVLRDKIVLSGNLCLALMAALLVSAANKHAFYVAYLLFTPYILFYLAYVPAGWIRKFNDFGDYSYGIYIYAFPVQQAVVHLFPTLNVLMATLLCLGITLTLSVMSWHLIEKSALDLKHKLSQRIQFLFTAKTLQA